MRAAHSDRGMARLRGASPHPRGVTGSDSTSQLRHVFGRWALLSLNDIELDAVALGEGFEAPALDRRVVDEAVLLPVLTSDEAKPFRIVEPLDGSGGTHGPTPKIICCVGVRRCRTNRHNGLVNHASRWRRRDAALWRQNAKRPARIWQAPIRSELVHALHACVA